MGQGQSRHADVGAAKEGTEDQVNGGALLLRLHDDLYIIGSE